MTELKKTDFKIVNRLAYAIPTNGYLQYYAVHV